MKKEELFLKTLWRDLDDEYCCEQFVKKYIIDKDFMDSSTFVYNLSLKLKNLSQESIKMKISNIIYIVNYLKIEHTCNIMPLTNFSKQNIVALVQILLKNNIRVDRELVKNLICERYKL